MFAYRSGGKEKRGVKAEERRLCSWEGVLETSMDLLGDEEGEACGGMWGATVLPPGGEELWQSWPTWPMLFLGG